MQPRRRVARKHAERGTFKYFNALQRPRSRVSGLRAPSAGCLGWILSQVMQKIQKKAADSRGHFFCVLIALKLEPDEGWRDL